MCNHVFYDHLGVWAAFTAVKTTESRVELRVVSTHLPSTSPMSHVLSGCRLGALAFGVSRLWVMKQ